MTLDQDKLSRPAHVIPVRPGESVDIVAIEGYLRYSIPGLPTDDALTLAQFPAGASNLTYLLCIGAWRAVLRRPPVGPLPPKAHDMKREADWLTALHPVYALAPQPYVFCDDSRLVGSPFYVMEYRAGAVMDKDWPIGWGHTQRLARDISRKVIETLVSLHKVDYVNAGLSPFGHPQGFLERQVRGWSERYEKSRTADVPFAASLISWLAKQLPPGGAVAVIHNDFKLNNMLFSDDASGNVVGVVDWEMATIGDPLLDVAVMLSYWVESDDSTMIKTMLPTITQQEGFLSRREMIELYAELSGRDLSNIDYYLVFAYFKLAVILQQIYVRYQRGQTTDTRFAQFGLVVNRLISHASQLAGVKE